MKKKQTQRTEKKLINKRIKDLKEKDQQKKRANEKLNKEDNCWRK